MRFKCVILELDSNILVNLLKKDCSNTTIYGLKVTWEMEFKCVILESDSNMLVNLLKKDCSNSRENHASLVKCNPSFIT